MVAFTYGEQNRYMLRNPALLQGVLISRVKPIY